MKKFTVLVKETRIIEYYIDAETKSEAKEFFIDGLISDFRVIQVDSEKVMEVFE